ncbi:MAG: hypothetical protein U9N57_07070 [Pseudomonadota bacterium]|nr:hypothetical protein [Pseudomonadota bacterium]
MSLQKTKVTLLAHSKNMRLAAEKGKWDRYIELDNLWKTMLENAVKEFGAELKTISSELLTDNENIQIQIKNEHQKLLSDLEKNTKSVSSIRSYLK